jgi:CheY-like chemotaxis protein
VSVMIQENTSTCRSGADPARSAVLLAEADALRANWVAHAVQRGGFDCDVHRVESGPDAIDVLFAAGSVRNRELAVAPQLVLLSRHLPLLDGLKVAKHLHWTHRDDRAALPPIVLYATSFEAGEIAEARRSGVSSCIQLSDGESRCIEEIQQALVYWLYLNQFPPAPHYHPGQLRNMRKRWLR